MTRERRFALTVLMTTSGMNALVTGAVILTGLINDGRIDVTELALLVFSIGAFALAYEVYRLQLERTRLISKTTVLTGAVRTQSEYIENLKRTQT